LEILPKNGTATGITWNIINSGDDINFTLQATAITGEGTVIPSLAAATVQTSFAADNTASTSTDNSVTYEMKYTVTVNQKGAQADPTSSLPIEFDVVFGQAIDNASFTTADITQNGTASGITWNIINSGDDTNYTLQATVITNAGTVVPSIAIDSTTSGSFKNYASASTDNSVDYQLTFDVTINQKGGQSDPATTLPVEFTVVFSEAINAASFTTADITQNGTASVDTWNIINSGDDTTFTIQVTATTADGTIVPSIAAGENDADGIELQGGSIQLNGGTMIGNVTSGAARLVLSGTIDPMTNVLVDTSQLPPNQVTGVTTAPTTSNTELGVSWIIPANNGTPITHYSVQYREQGTSTWLNKSPNPTSNSTTITGLTAGITYEIRVAASNGVLGPYSAISTAEIFDVMSLNPIAWLDATDVNGDGSTPANGTKVATWVDLTGVAQDATEANVALQPVYEHNAQNGLPAVRFDNLDRGLSGGFTRSTGTDLTIIIVGQYDNGYSDKCMLEFQGPGNARAFFIDRRYAGNTLYSPALTKGSFRMWTITNSGTYSTVTEDGTTQMYAGNNDFNTDFTGAGTYYLGDDATGGNRMYGYIGEILIFDNALSAQDISDLETYLQNKWGLP
jgi:hypothetical protein